MDGKKLVGVITQSDIFDAFIEMMGARNAGARLEIKVPSKAGIGADILGIIRDAGVNILHMVLNNGNSENGELIMKLDSEDVDDICKKLRERGYAVNCG